MVDYSHFALFWKGSVDKQWKIEYDGGLITNEELFDGDIELSESLCSETELRFGCCEASCLKFTVGNIILPLIGKWLTVSVVLDHHTDDPLAIGRYKVASDKPTADRRQREIVAYDAMYDIIGADMAAWYNSVLPDKESTVTMQQFRESFMQHFEISEQLPEGGLVNDDMTVERTIEPEQISGLDVITAICEINGCFGHIGRDGRFHYIYLPQAIEGLYPADDLFPDRAPEWMAQARTGHLYPQDPKGTGIDGNVYIEVHYEDFRTKPITMLQIRQSENEIGKVYPERELEASDNCYIIEDNFLVYGKTDEQLGVIASRIFGKITDIVYRPFDADCPGNPCLEVGDPVRFPTRYELVESYILTRTLKGVQALRDDYRAEGVERYAEKVNGINRSIIQLKGLTNTLTRTVEETRLEMKDVEKGLTTEITATAEQIRLDADRKFETKIDAGKEYTSLHAGIALEAGRITSEVERATQAEKTLSGQIVSTSATLSSKIEQTEKDINLSVSQSIQETRTYASTQATAAQNAANTATDSKLKSYSTTIEMNSAIKLASDSITSTVEKTYETKTDAGTQYESLSSSITQTVEQVSQKVSKGTLSSEISQEAGKISITSDRFSLESTNCTITEDGTIKAVNCELSGKLKTVTIENDGIIIDQYGLILLGNGGIRYQRSYGSFYEAFSLLTASGDDVTLNALGSLTLRGKEITIGEFSYLPSSISAAARQKIEFSINGFSLLTLSSKEVTPSGTVSLGTSSNRFDTLYTKVINHSGGNIGFFGTTPAAKQTVSTVASTSSATSSSNAVKINEVINALKKYGLL